MRGGAISPGERVYCPGHMSFGGRRFHCWKRGGHGWMDFNDAITQSCDVYFYEAANRLGVDRLAELCFEFGLGTRHDIADVGHPRRDRALDQVEGAGSGRTLEPGRDAEYGHRAGRRPGLAACSLR